MNTDVIIGYIFGLIGIILSIIGIVLTVRSNKKKEPVYSIKSVNVISDYTSTYANLAVSYKGEKVESFTVSKVLFFNRGATALDKDDIAPLNHLRIEANSGNILDATVLQVNNPSSDFRVSLDKVNELIVIDFDYLNQNHGAVVEVIHTGLSSEDIDVVGDMKEVKELKRLSPNSLRRFYPLNLRRVIGNMALFFLTLTIIFSMSATTYTIWRSNRLGWFDYVLTTMLLLITLSLISVSFLRLFSRSPVIPMGLEKFDE